MRILASLMVRFAGGNSQIYSDSVAKSGHGARAGLRFFHFAILRRGRGFQVREKAGRDCGNLIDRGVERRFIAFGWLRKAADFADKLDGGSADLFFGGWGIEVK